MAHISNCHDQTITLTTSNFYRFTINGIIKIPCIFTINCYHRDIA